MANKITKQELKEPDKLQVMFAQATFYFSKRRKEIAIGAGVAVLLVVAVAGWYFYRQHEEGQALTQYNKALEELSKAKSIGMKPEGMVKLFEEVVKKHPGTRAAAFSLYRLGNIYLDMNNIDGAIKAYKDYLNENSEENEFRVLVYNGLGAAYETKKDYKTALGYYENAIQTKAGHLFESINYENMARAYESLNDPKKALEYYKKAAEKAKDPSMKELLNRKISSLG